MNRRTVRFNTGIVLDAEKGEEIVVGVVQVVHEDGSLDIWVPDPSTGAGSIARNVTRRDPAHYGLEGGGHTYH